MNCALMRDAVTEDAVTTDAVLGGALRLRQPRRGHRVGHDAMLLAAACPVKAGEHVVDLGAGVGAAGLAVALRTAGATVTLVEIDADLAALAAENARLNQLESRVKSVVLDATAPGRAYVAAGLAPDSVARVLMNPPFNDAPTYQASPDHRRRLAHAAPRESLSAWIKGAARLLRPRGTLTLIYRPDGLGDLVKCLEGAFGAIAILPIYPQPNRPAIRVLLRAIKASRAPLALWPGLMLADEAGHPTAEAEAILRQGATLPLGQF
jgi:tRNA1(Val) A37 N6-methylase TrmN6